MKFYAQVWLQFQHYGPNRKHISISVQECDAKGNPIWIHHKMLPLPDVLPMEAEIVEHLLPGAVHHTTSEEKHERPDNK